MKYLLTSLFLATGASAQSYTRQELALINELFAAPRPAGSCACTFDDPHVRTFDNMVYDCQGDGDFILSKSMDSDFELQGRFFKPEGWGNTKIPAGTTTKAAVVTTGAPGEPRVEMFAGSANNTLAQCEMEWAFDGETKHLGAVEDLGFAIFFRHQLDRYLYFRDSGVWMKVSKRFYFVFGCYINMW